MGWRSAQAPGTPSSGCGTRDTDHRDGQETVIWDPCHRARYKPSDLQIISENENDGETENVCRRVDQ